MSLNLNSMLVMWCLATINIGIASYQPTPWICAMAGYTVGMATAQTMKWYFERQ